jgi:CheY-like chemotaxis protein
MIGGDPTKALRPPHHPYRVNARRGSRNCGIDCAAGERQHGGVSPRTPTPSRVLIVDDQPSFRGMARKVLEWRGYVVAGEADSAASAIDAAERLAPDAVLLDVCLGEDSGFDVACALTQARPGLAVLLVSSVDYRQCEPLVRECGARGFVLKSDLACVDLEDFWQPGII